MASEWKALKIGEVFDLVCGYAFKSSDFRDEGVPVIKIKNVKADGVVLDDLDFVDAKFLDLRKDKIVRDGDILITMSGNRFDGSKGTWVGKVAQYRGTNTFLLNQRVGILRPKRASEVEQRACTYFLASEANQHLFIAIATSSGGQANLSPGQILGAELILPPLEEQRAIAHILGTLDDKIELNRKRNETLEAMARALFQSWFVDFDPVRAKAAMRREHPRWTDAEVCRAALPTLAPEIAALFPDSFENSALGDIPKGWRVGSLSDVAFLNPESWSRTTKPEIIRYIDLANTKWGRIEAITVYSKEDAPSRAQRVLRCGDTIVGTVRPGNGSNALIAEDGLTGSTGFAVLRPRKSECREFIYLTATAQDNIESLAHLADGGAYPAVRPEVVIAKQIVMPPDAVIANFAKLTEPLISRLAQGERESNTLAALRDTLLPKLISGELRIKNVERFVEGAL